MLIYGKVNSVIDDKTSWNKLKEGGGGRGQTRGDSSGGQEEICNESVVSELFCYYTMSFLWLLIMLLAIFAPVLLSLPLLLLLLL